MNDIFRPKIFTTLKEYSFKQFRHDFTAGMIVGVVALPLAIAFAIASGVSPDRGLVTAIVAGFIISFFGGSRVQIGGPTGAFVIIIYSIVQKFGMDGLIVATFLGGLIICAMGAARLGSLIKFIPYPLIVGFTSGIALIIFSSQIKDLFGLPINDVPAEFFEKWAVYYEHLHLINPAAAVIGLGTILFIVVWQRSVKVVPGSLIALIGGTVLVSYFKIPVETIATRFGEIPNYLPIPRMPSIDFSVLPQLIPVAFTIALLGSIESLLSAVVADGMIGSKHRSNTELIAQGIANIVSSLFGGIPATGAIARTATNVHHGGRTPISGIVHALTLLLIMLVFGRWAVHIPLAVLAGVLVLVAYRMSEWRSFMMILKAPKSDAAVLIVTFLLTVTVDLTVAIEIGMVLASFLLMHRLVQASNFSQITTEFVDNEDGDDPDSLNRREIPQDVEVYEINGPFFFGVASRFVDVMSNIEKNPKVRILRMRHVLSIDATALNALKRVFDQSRKNGIAMIISGIHAQPLIAVQRSGLADEIGIRNICRTFDSSLERAKEILNHQDLRHDLPKAYVS